MPKRILIVDDSMFMRAKMKWLLEKWGYEVVGQAVDGFDGIEKFKRLHPDIVLLDITMPKLDGISALKGIIAFDAKAVVVMVSAMGQDDNMREAIRAGAKNYVIKPFKDDRVKELLDGL